MWTDCSRSLPGDIFSLLLPSRDSSVVIETLQRSQLASSDMFCFLWSSRNTTQHQKDLSCHEASDISIESLPSLDSYQRIMSWLSNCDYEQQNISYSLETEDDNNDDEEDEEEESQTKVIKELKKSSKTCHPKKFFRSSKLFKHKTVDSCLPKTTLI